MDQLTKDTEDMCFLVCNLKEQEHSVSQTSHSTVLLMPTQKFILAMLEIENALDPRGLFTMRAALQLSSLA